MGTKTAILLGSVGLSLIGARNGSYSYLSGTTVWITALLFFVQLFAYLAWVVVIYPRLFSPLRNLPSPPGGHYVIGHTHSIVTQPTGKRQREWIHTVPNDGLIRYRMWFQDRLLLTSPKALAEVLVQRNYDFVKPFQFRGLIRLLGEGILLAEGDEHKKQRKDLMPAFAYRHVKDLYSVFWGKAREMVECLEKASNSDDTKLENVESEATETQNLHQPGSIEVGNFASRTTLDIVGLAGMGSDFNSLKNPENKLNVMYRTVFNPGKLGRILQILGTLVPIELLRALPVQRNTDIQEASNYIKEVCREMIGRKHKAIEEKAPVGKDIISVALQSGGFTDEQLVNQCMTFLAAGHETTATATIWGIFLLCRHPDVQERLREEVRSKLPSIDSEVTAAQIDDCDYLQAVCLEILRIQSPVGLTLRVAGRDSSIVGQFVPKGTLIILSPGAINTSEELWGADALEFKPERWLDADGKANKQGSADSNFSFLTFLHGPRSCIGQRFAQAEFACILAAWIGTFKTEFEKGSPLASGEPELSGGITKKPKGGVWVKLTKVEGW